MKLNTSLVGTNQLLYATYFGGGGDTRAGNGSLDLGNGVVAIVGSTTSNSANGDIPLRNAFQTKNSASGYGHGWLSGPHQYDANRSGEPAVRDVFRRERWRRDRQRGDV